MTNVKSYRCTEPCTVLSPSGQEFVLEGDIIVVTKNYTGTTKSYSLIYAADFEPIPYDEDLKSEFSSSSLRAFAFTGSSNIDSLVNDSKLVTL